MIIHDLGMVQNYNIFDHDILCPCCEKKMFAFNCAFKNCEWKYKCKKLNNEIVESEWKSTPQTGYVTFDKEKAEYVSFLDCEFSTRI